MLKPVPAEVLRHVREASNVSQTTLAKRMNTVASVLSKMEKADEAEPEFAQRYLSAIGTSLAADAANYYSRNWHQEPPPSYLHPDREGLWTIDQALQALEQFEAEKQDPILRGPIDLLRGELKVSENYLKRRDHTVAWVGDIGVGKTTALSHAVDLLVGDGRSIRRPAFPVGPGRTTVCEMAIRVAPTYGILVDAIDDQEVIQLARDLVAGQAPDANGIGVAAEIGRLLRNMSKFKIATSMVGDELVTQDPIVDLLKEGLTVDEVTDRLVVALSLKDRTENQIILPEGSEDGLLWVSRMVSAINSGLDPRFGVPRRVTVLMPSKNLSGDGQLLSVIDTRGVEGVTQRSDLAVHNDDPRTLVVLCTKFADAPNATVQRHLRETVDAASDAIERHRRCILVLPRGDEALEVPGFEGPVTSREEGYALRRKEIELSLVNAQLPKAPIYFFDAKNDASEKIWTRLRAQIGQIRGSYVQRGKAAADGVQDLITNVDGFRTLESRRDVEQEVSRLLPDVANLTAVVRPAYLNLMEQMAIGHHSSVAASIARRGAWENFPIALILGNGVRIDANLRSQSHVQRIEHRLMDLESKYKDMDAVVRSLHALRARLADGRQEFLGAAQIIGRDAYNTLMSREADVWTRSQQRYGQGPGYKAAVAGIWREWLETSPDAHAMSVAIGERLQDAWLTWVLEPLRRATQAIE
ncbi:helix-turn-helix domain-containing protein [Agrobacterium tumefaciens]|uniref:Helix-turn-helix transcriptional regulator n=1 Tax=Agrobacterium tumefaciens TaxID=358 RepID=A0A4D7YVB4_AGRTU|nr:helix-turn-helix transcriptional regulator [Agrobacterium tumefaciens]QCL97836.1 helix-turn-helix transcriptional regulator [Agrobacterium tumefaciens]